MLEPKNVVNITGGIVQDPERPTENIAKFRLGVDYAASEKDSDNNSGYFDIVYYLNNDDGKRNADFVRRQLDEEKMGKGSGITVLGRLVQERWETNEGEKRQRVVIVAESLTYSGTRRPEGAEGAANAGEAAPAQTATHTVPKDF